MKPNHATEQKLTYSITGRHQQGNTVRTIEIGNLSFDEVLDKYKQLIHEYRSVEILCEQTGEVMCSKYMSLEIWALCN